MYITASFLSLFFITEDVWVQLTDFDLQVDT